MDDRLDPLDVRAMKEIRVYYIDKLISAKLKADFDATYHTIKMVDTQVIWSNYIYDNKAMENMYNYLDCSFLCKNVEKGNACDLFTFEEHSCYLGKSRHSTGVIETDLLDATIYITTGKF